MVVTNVKASVESGKFILKIRSESGKLFTIGCHLPPKSTNFVTLLTIVSLFLPADVNSGTRHVTFSLLFSSGGRGEGL